MEKETSTAISSPFPHHAGLSHAGRILLSRKALRTKHILPKHLLCHLLLNPGHGTEVGWTERLYVPHCELPAPCAEEGCVCMGSRVRSCPPFSCLGSALTGKDSSGGTPSSSPYNPCIFRLGCGWCFTQPGGWIWCICWDPACLGSLPGMLQRSWFGWLVSLLCCQLRASISQQCSHRLCIPSLRAKTCGMLLVVLTNVSW